MCRVQKRACAIICSISAEPDQAKSTAQLDNGKSADNATTVPESVDYPDYYVESSCAAHDCLRTIAMIMIESCNKS